MITLRTVSLRAACTMAATMAATKDARFYLCGVHVMVNADGVAYLQAVDGKVAFEDEQPGSSQEDAGTQIVIPLDKAKYLAKSRMAAVLLSPQTDGSWQSSEQIGSTPIEGEFPDFSRIMPARNPGYDALFSPYNWELVARCQKAMRIALGEPSRVFPLQNAPDLGAGLMYCPERAYPRCSVMPYRL